MNQLSVSDRVAILNCLSEGMGINATARTTGTSKNTVLKLLCDVGAACAAYQDRAMNNLRCTRIQCDEIWSFVGAKQKNARPNDKAHAEYGDVYTFTAMDPDTKLMPCWLVGPRPIPSSLITVHPGPSFTISGLLLIASAARIASPQAAIPRRAR